MTVKWISRRKWLEHVCAAKLVLFFCFLFFLFLHVFISLLIWGEHHSSSKLSLNSGENPQVERKGSALEISTAVLPQFTDSSKTTVLMSPGLSWARCFDCLTFSLSTLNQSWGNCKKWARMSFCCMDVSESRSVRMAVETHPRPTPTEQEFSSFHKPKLDAGVKAVLCLWVLWQKPEITLQASVSPSVFKNIDLYRSFLSL